MIPGLATIDIGFGEARIELNRVGEVGDGELVIFQAPPRDAATVVA